LKRYQFNACLAKAKGVGYFLWMPDGIQKQKREYMTYTIEKKIEMLNAGDLCIGWIHESTGNGKIRDAYEISTKAHGFKNVELMRVYSAADAAKITQKGTKFWLSDHGQILWTAAN